MCPKDDWVKRLKMEKSAMVIDTTSELGPSPMHPLSYRPWRSSSASAFVNPYARLSNLSALISLPHSMPYDVNILWSESDIH